MGHPLGEQHLAALGIDDPEAPLGRGERVVDDGEAAAADEVPLLRAAIRAQRERENARGQPGDAKRGLRSLEGLRGLGARGGTMQRGDGEEENCGLNPSHAHLIIITAPRAIRSRERALNLAPD